ncbi:MAG: hypothetical protein RL260_3320 [Pseudomonadota bacterium]
MAYGKYGHGSELRDAIDRLVKGSTQNDPNTRAIEDGVVPGSSSAGDR